MDFADSRCPVTPLTGQLADAATLTRYLPSRYFGKPKTFSIRTTDSHAEAGTVRNTTDQELEVTRDLHIASAVDLEIPISLPSIEVVTLRTADALSDSGFPHLAGRLCPEELEKTQGGIIVNHYRSVRRIDPKDPTGANVAPAAHPPPLPVGTIYAPSKRSSHPLPSQKDAYKGTSTALINSPDAPPAEAPTEKQKPNYAPTGLLAAETNTVANTSIVLKYHEPPESRLPPASQSYLLYVFKSSNLLQKITLNERSCWLFGREAMVADIPVEHPSASKQHAVLQFRHVVKKDEFGEKRGRVGLYVLDLDSANGTFLNGERMEGRRYVEVRGGDVLRWGESSREYVLLVPPKEMG
ncbi:MAG: hypothetical protein Q9182_003359 [Xanthomendoza sp. 2 TL-2023]